jgi:hypothetical protein
MGRTRKSELALVGCFLGILTAVPIAQTWLELRRGEKVQFTDVFRLRPTSRNLRQFEDALEDQSWFQQQLRPATQRALFEGLKDMGAKGILGRERWVFYRPDVRYLVEPDRAETDATGSLWVKPSEGLTRRDSAVRAVTRFRDQLKQRGLRLLVVPIPGKPGIYPDKLTRRAKGRVKAVESPTLELIRALKARGVETVDLFTVFQAARARSDAAGQSLYLAQDTHWTPAGAKLAAETVAARLQSLGWAPPASKEFRARPVRVKRWGDVLEMMAIPGLRSHFGPELVECAQVADPALGLLIPTASDRPGAYRYPGGGSSLLVLGDSFCRIYQYPEPQTLGEAVDVPSEAKPRQTGVKQLLPGSAGFVSLLAARLQAPVDSIVSDGGASTDVRRKLSTHPEILEGKKVVVWEFVERDVGLGCGGWEDVPLPPRLGQ